MTGLELRITRRGADGLTTASRYLGDRHALREALIRAPAGGEALIEAFSGPDPLLYLMTDGARVHMSLWKSSAEWYYLVSGAPDGDAPAIDIGWHAFPGWTVTQDVARAMAAAAAFLDGGALEPALRWHRETD